MKTQNIVVLTGAGISAESGLATFRGGDGLWCGHRIEDVATPEAFARNPHLVYEFYNMRRSQLREVQPNAAHHALAQFAKRWEGNFLLVTQNVDDLHGRALRDAQVDTDNVLLHMHGELRKARCMETGKMCEWWDDMDAQSLSPFSNRAGDLRPHIVWFGEMPLEMPRIEQALARCDVFISIGTSGNVYPAAGFVMQARAAGAHTVELNLEPSLGESLFAEKIYGRATDIVPTFLERL
jgi:NAD-dependent deacetylase